MTQQKHEYPGSPHDSPRLITIPSGAQCSGCDHFRPSPSICILKDKTVKWYNKCEHFVRARTGNTTFGTLE